MNEKMERKIIAKLRTKKNICANRLSFVPRKRKEEKKSFNETLIFESYRKTIHFEQR